MPHAYLPETTARKLRCDDLFLPEYQTSQNTLIKNHPVARKSLHPNGNITLAMNGCVTKPIDRAELARAINTAMSEEINTPIVDDA